MCKGWEKSQKMPKILITTQGEETRWKAWKMEEDTWQIRKRLEECSNENEEWVGRKFEFRGKKYENSGVKF